LTPSGEKRGLNKRSISIQASMLFLHGRKITIPMLPYLCNATHRKLFTVEWRGVSLCQLSQALGQQPKRTCLSDYFGAAVGYGELYGYDANARCGAGYLDFRQKTDHHFPRPT
jgi:hypothetical protein